MQYNSDFAKKYQQHRFWQTFFDKSIERDYQRYFETSQHGAIAFSCLFAVVLYPLFGILDWLISHDPFILLLRALGWLPLVALGLIFWRDKSVGRYQEIAFIAALCSGLGIIAIIAVGNQTIQHHYPYGISLIVLFATIPFFIRFQYVALLAFILASILVFTLMWLRPLHEVSLANGFIISCSLALTCGGAYYVERFFRSSYLQSCLEAALLAASQELNSAKDDFIAVMSHELKTPLTVIRGNGEIIRDELFGAYEENKAVYAQLSHDLCEQVQHLLSIINDLLDISKAQAGQLELTKEAYDFVGEAQQIVQQMQRYPSQSSFQLELQTTLPLLRITADKRRLRQALMNLLSNAIKFNRTEGRIRVLITASDTSFTCTVADEGIGIAEEDQQRIFEPFQQARHALNRHYDGTGLGLPFVKNIIEAHKGQLFLESELGKGTKIMFTMPL